MIVEQATVQDAAEILALQGLAYWDEAKIYGDYSIPPLTQTVEEIEAEFDRQFFLKASVNGGIIGSVRAHMVQGTCLIGSKSARNLHLYRKSGYRQCRTQRLMDWVTLVFLQKTGHASRGGESTHDWNSSGKPLGTLCASAVNRGRPA